MNLALEEANERLKVPLRALTASLFRPQVRKVLHQVNLWCIMSWWSMVLYVYK
jgi:hypothetical protein